MTRKMPPELLAHFKKKEEGKTGSNESGNKDDKTRRKEAVKKARVRLEEGSRRKHAKNEEEKAGKEGTKET